MSADLSPRSETAIVAEPGELLAETQALCPDCLAVRPAVTVERDGKVWLRRDCPDHGTAETLVLSDAAWWRWSRKFVRAGRAPVHTATASEHGCPYDCGFCPDHQQHACVTVYLENTSMPNLSEAFQTLPEPLDSALAWVACAAGALRADGYVALLEEAGFTVEHTVDESPALGDMVAKARRRLALFRGASGVGLLPTLEEFVGPDLAALGRTVLGHDDLADGGRTILTQVADAVHAGNLGYLALIAHAA